MGNIVHRINISDKNNYFYIVEFNFFFLENFEFYQSKLDFQIYVFVWHIELFVEGNKKY